jgi:NADPH:quinone reductase-like Zn-dependent oxidoreductase
MPNAVVMTGYGPPEVLKWAAVPLPEPGQGQIRIKVEAAGTVDAAGPGVTGTSAGDAVTADETMAMLAGGKLRLHAHQTMPMPQAAEAHRQLESGTVHERIILTLP